MLNPLWNIAYLHIFFCILDWIFCSLRKGKSISFSSEGTAFSVTEWLIEKRESQSIGIWMISDEDLDSRNCSLDRKNICTIVKVFVSLEPQNYESLVPCTQGAIKPRQHCARFLQIYWHCCFGCLWNLEDLRNKIEFNTFLGFWTR